MGEKAKARLLEFWEPGPDFGDPVGCVATTYTFDAGFFEEECLGRFAGIQSSSAEDGAVYLIEREEKLSQCFACVLVDQAHVAANRSLRWHLLPVRLAGGIQHAKLSILAWRHHVRVLVGSANLTVPGYRRNYENVAVLDFHRDNGLPLELLKQGLGFIDQVRQAAPGLNASDGAQPALQRFLETVRSITRSWPDGSWPRGEPRVYLVPIRPGGPSMFEQVQSRMHGRLFDSVWVQSPFFSDDDDAQAVVSALEGLLAQRGERTINFVSPGRELPNGTVELEMPDTLRTPGHPRLNYQFHYVDELYDHTEDESRKDERRPLHAKSLWFENEGGIVYVVGSSNFTVAGTGIGRRTRGNLELNVLYAIPDPGSDFATVCNETLVPCLSVDIEEQDVSFLGSLGDRTADGAECPALPEAFGAAMYDPRPRVSLEIGGAPPGQFRVLGPDDYLVLAEAAWRETDSPSSIVMPWPFDRPPSHLVVTWPNDDAVPLRAIWPVNVVDTGLLPSSDELCVLTLEELVDVLTSAQPTHEAMRRILRRRKKSKKPLPILDPHKRVDTHGFLLKRMARVGAALEGLRERLQRPVSSREALRWRMEGPVGPLALARRLAKEERDGAAFMIVEVAQTVADVQLHAVGEVSKAVIHSQIQSVLRELLDLAKAHPSPATLAGYVDARFVELQR